MSPQHSPRHTPAPVGGDVTAVSSTELNKIMTQLAASERQIALLNSKTERMSQMEQQVTELSALTRQVHQIQESRVQDQREMHAIRTQLESHVASLSSDNATKASRIEELERQVHHLQHQAASSESRQGIPQVNQAEIGQLQTMMQSYQKVLRACEDRVNANTELVHSLETKMTKAPAPAPAPASHHSTTHLDSLSTPAHYSPPASSKFSAKGSSAYGTPTLSSSYADTIDHSHHHSAGASPAAAGGLVSGHSAEQERVERERQVEEIRAMLQRNIRGSAEAKLGKPQADMGAVAHGTWKSPTH